ncbi:Cyclin-dependent kinase 1, partial [Galemys pyrenaicus]
MEIQKLISFSNFSECLGTPNNEMEPADYKSVFPKWKPGSPTSYVKILNENGLDLPALE